MFDSKAILQLFTDVMYGDVANHSLSDSDIAEKLNNMEGVYSQDFGSMKVVDYNGVANRCAYLHKYAPLYTAIVSDTMRRLLSDDMDLKSKLQSRTLRICSLGGGPGTDVVGVLAALDATFGSSHQWRTFVSAVEYMSGWKLTFKSVVNELRKSGFQDFSSRFTAASFSWKYIQADVLQIRRSKVRDAVSCSSLVTMVKCLSTFRTADIHNAIRKIFKAISFGSYVLIIDDAVEELCEIALRTATEHQMIPIFGAPRSRNYSFDELKVTRFGHVSCHQATVISLLLVKPLMNPSPVIAVESQVDRLCVKCSHAIHMCTKCRRPRTIRNCVVVTKRVPFRNASMAPVDSGSTSVSEPEPPGSNNPDAARGSNDIKDGVDSLTLSDTTVDNSVVSSDSVVIELPE